MAVCEEGEGGKEGRKEGGGVLQMKDWTALE